MDAPGPAARDLFSQMGGLFSSGPVSEENGPSKSASTESINTQEMEGLMSETQMLASPFTFSEPTFVPFLSPDIPMRSASPIVSILDEPVPSASTTAETPINAEAPRMTGSMPRFPTPDSTRTTGPSPALSAPLSAPPTGGYDTKAFAGAQTTMMPSVSPASLPRSANQTPSPPPARPRRKSFASMRFRSRSVGHGDLSPPSAAAHALHGLGLASSSPSSPPEQGEGSNRVRRPSLSSKFSRVFSKGKHEDTPPMPQSPPNTTSSPPRKTALNSGPPRTSPGLTLVTADLQTPSSRAPTPSSRAPSPLSSRARDLPPPSSPVASIHSMNLQNLPPAATFMHNIPTTAARTPSPRSAPKKNALSSSTGSKPQTRALDMQDLLDLSGGISLPAPSSALFGFADGPYAALRTVARSQPSTPVSSPVDARPQFSLRVVEARVPASNRSSTASSVATRPKRSSSMVTIGPESKAPELVRSNSSDSPAKSRSAPSLLSPVTASFPRMASPPPIVQPAPVEPVVAIKREKTIAFLEPPGLKPAQKVLRRLSSLSSLPDRLAAERLAQTQEEDGGQKPKKAASSNSRRRSSLSYLQPLLTSAKTADVLSPTESLPSPVSERSSLDTVASSNGTNEGEDSLQVTISPSSSIEHFARVLEAGLDESVSDHSHSEEAVVIPRRPSTRIFNLVNAALGPDVLPAFAEESESDDSEEAQEIINDSSAATPVQRQSIIEAGQVETLDGIINYVPEESPATPLVEAQEETEQLDGPPMLPELDVNSSSPEDTTSFWSVAGSPEVVGRPLSMDSEPVEILDLADPTWPNEDGQSATLKVESTEMDANEKSLDGVSSTSSYSEAPSPLFERSRRASSESPAPSETGHSAKAASDEQEHLVQPRAGQEEIVYAQPAGSVDLSHIRQDSIVSEGENPINRFSRHLEQADDLPESEVEEDGEQADAYSSSEVEENESDDEQSDDDDLPLVESVSREAQRASPEKAKLVSTRRASTQQQRNPFNFEPNNMQKRDRRGNLHPLPPEPELPARAPSPPTPTIGHPLLPQTDEHVQLRTKRSLARLSENTARSPTLLQSPTSPISPASPELPAFVQESVLAMSEPEDNASALARKASVGKALASLTRPRTTSSEGRVQSPSAFMATVRPAPSSVLLQPPPPGRGVRPEALRILFEDKERCAVVQTYDNTTIADILNQLDATGHIPTGEGRAQWALFEHWSDLGIERPLREFELIGKVLASWPVAGADNKLILKRTKVAFARLCSGKRIPQARDAPIGHYVRLEMKRGKWEKRWFSLDNLAVTASKSEKGKEKQSLCNMTNWDVYLVPGEFIGALRPPHPFALALKSADSLGNFKEVDQAIWYLSCKTGQEAETWYSWLFDARTRFFTSMRNANRPSNVSAGGSLPSPTSLQPFMADPMLSKLSAEEKARADAARRSTLKTMLELSGTSNTIRPASGRIPAPVVR